MTEKENTPQSQLISLQEAAKVSPHSAEYLRLLARQGKLFSQRVNGKWFTTREAVQDYLDKQSLTIVIPRAVLTGEAESANASIRVAKGGEAIVSSSSGKTDTLLEGIHATLTQLRQQQVTGDVLAKAVVAQLPPVPQPILPQAPVVQTIQQQIPESITHTLEKISDSLKNLSSLQEIQLQQVQLQRETTQETTSTQQLHDETVRTNEKSEKILERIDQGLRAILNQREVPQQSNVAGDQVQELNATLGQVATNLQHLSNLQNFQLKQLQLQQESFWKSVHKNLDQKPQDVPVVPAVAPVQQVSETQQNFRREMDDVLQRIYATVDRLVESQEIQANQVKLLQQNAVQSQMVEERLENANREHVEQALTKISHSIATLAEAQEVASSHVEELVQVQEQQSQRQSEALRAIAEVQTTQQSRPVSALTPAQQEFVDIESQRIGYKMRQLSARGRSLLHQPRWTFATMVAAISVIFLAVGGVSFSQVDDTVQKLRETFKNADTLGGHFAGTNENEVLLLDKAGNISIYGHVETQGQLKSFAPDGVAPIVVDSQTLVENLNANYLDGLASKDFTLAFVTKNGNVTYENVTLGGRVEVGKTLTVRGATKLLNELEVSGGIGVINDVAIRKGNLRLDEGTIVINNRSLIKNLNSEFLNGYRSEDLTLDFVVGQGDSTNHPAFFNGGLYGGDGAFSSLGVSGDVSIGDTENPNDSRFTVSSKYFRVGANGDTRISGSLIVGDTVQSDLTPSGSFDLGTSTNHWDSLYVNNIVGNINLGGTTSSSFTINSDNTSDDGESSYLSFERGAASISNATLTWNASADRFEFNQPVLIASSGATNAFSVTGRAYITGPLEVQSYVSSSFAIFTDAINAGLDGAGSTTSYNRFGAGTTTHSNYISATNDLLVAGDIEVNATAAFDGHTVIGDATDGNDRLIVNSQVNSDFIPYLNNVYSVGSATNRWKGYFTNVDALSFSAASTSLSGTNADTFTLNADNTSADSENSQLIFTRGTPTTSAQIQWQAAQKRFNFNFPVFIQSTDASEPVNNYTKLTLKAAADQDGIDYFEIQNYDGSRLLIVEQGGRFAASGSFQAAGGIVTSVSYSRFGANTTGHSTYLNSMEDLLVSGDFEVDGKTFLGGTASISDSLELGGYASASAYYGGGLTNCSGASFLQWSSVSGDFACTVASLGTKIKRSGTQLLSAANILNFDDGKFNITASGSTEAFVNLDWVNGPASRTADQTISGLWNFTGGASVSSPFEVSGAASISNVLWVSPAGYPGKVGIGTKAPNNAYLDIAGGGSAGDLALAFNCGSSCGIYPAGGGVLGFAAGGAGGPQLAINGSVASGLGLPSNGEVRWSSGNASWGSGNDVSLLRSEAGILKVGDGAASSPALASLIAKRIGLGSTTAPTTALEVSGTASSSRGAITNELNVAFGNAATVAYSRFGTAATGHSLATGDDLLVTGELEVDGTGYFDGNLTAANTTTTKYLVTSTGGYVQATGDDGSTAIYVDGSGNPVISFYRRTATTTQPGGLKWSTDQDGTYTVGLVAGGTNKLRISDGGTGTTGLGSLLGKTSEFQGTSSASYGLFGALQVAGFSSTSYSRFGTGTTGHSLSAAQDLLLSGNLEIDGTTYFDGATLFNAASISQNLEVVGYASLSNALFTNPTTNYVGIGTTSPASALHVVGNITSPGTGTASEKLGLNATSTGDNQVVIGNGAIGGSTDGAVVIGQGANPSTRAASILIGKAATTSSIGSGTSIAIGNAANGGRDGLAIGNSSQASTGTSNDIVIGHSSTGGGSGITIGMSATGQSGSFVAGSQTAAITNVYFGDGVQKTTSGTGGSSYVINGTAGLGTNQNGGSITLAGGKGTGTGTGGSLIFSTADVLTTGSTLQSLTEKARILHSGFFGIGTTAPSTKLEVQGTSSASYGLFGALQVAGFSSTSYSRFGTNTTNHSNYISATNDLLISGDLEVDGSVSFAGPASISGDVYLNSNNSVYFGAPSNEAVQLKGTNYSGTGALQIGNAQGASGGGVVFSFGVFTNYVLASNNKLALNNNGLAIGNAANAGISFIDGDYNGTTDLKLIRNAARVLEINNGTSGQYGKLLAGNTEVQGTSSASYGLFGALQVAGFSSTSYSRFGTAATGHSLSAAQDLLLSGILEVDGATYLDGAASVAGSFEAVGYASASAYFGTAFGSTGDCNDSGEALGWDSATGTFSCLAVSASGGAFSGIEVTNDLGSTYAHITSLSFEPNMFNISNTASSSLVKLDWTNGPASRSATQSITGLWSFTQKVGIGTSSPATMLEVQGTSSASYGLFGALQVAGFSSTSYSRFGTDTTGYSSFLSGANDLLVSGDVEVNGSAFFDGTTSVSNNFEVQSANSRAFVISDAGGAPNDIFTIDTTSSASNAGLDITGGPTQTGNLLTFYGSQSQTFSRFSARGGLVVNIASTSALAIQNGSAVDVFRVDAFNSRVGIGTSSPETALEVVGTASTSKIITDLVGTQTTSAVCHTTNGQTLGQELVDCDPTAADYMELYPTAPTVTESDLVSLSKTEFALTDRGDRVAQVVQSAVAYDPNLIGIVSIASDASDFNSIGHNLDKADNPMPVALAGRVLVKVSLENGPIAVGDRLTSSTTPGVAMRADRAGMTVGMALEPLSTISSGSYAKVMVFVKTGYWAPDAVQTTPLSSPVATLVSAGITVAPSQSSGILNSLRVTGDAIFQGVRKSYTATADLFQGYDLASMARNWLSRPVSLDSTDSSEGAGLFRGQGAQAADESKVDLQENGAYLSTYGLDSTRQEIYVSGSSQIAGGEAKIFFDFSFTKLISPETPIKVIITPTSNLQGQLYVANKNEYGFVVRELNAYSTGTFDWITIARRKGADDPVASPTTIPSPSPSVTPEQTITVAPTPSLTPEATSTPETSMPPEPSTSPAPEVSTTPEPTPTLSVEATPTPTESPTLSASPEPTSIEIPTETPMISPEPSPTPESTPVPTNEQATPTL